MSVSAELPVIAFVGCRRIAEGPLSQALDLIHASAREGGAQPQIFDRSTGRPVDLDLRGSLEDARARLETPADPKRRGPGRPKLGVVAREVTLLPRHWEWLGAQPGGASVALRKLVEAQLADSQGHDRTRRAQDAAYRFLTAMGGDRPGYEEAVRRLFAGDQAGFDALIESWPDDVRQTARSMAAGAWPDENASRVASGDFG